MDPSKRASDLSAIVGVIDPDAYAAATYTSGWIAAKDFQQFKADVLVGVMAATATVDAKIEQATDAAGTGAKDIAGKAITQLTQAGGDSDKQVSINVAGKDLDTENSFTHFRLSVTVAAASVDLGAVVQGLWPTYGPATDHDLASVDEIVT